jgi:cobalt-zinc-cadmium efflux system membrane fusion protein
MMLKTTGPRLALWCLLGYLSACNRVSEHAAAEGGSKATTDVATQAEAKEKKAADPDHDAGEHDLALTDKQISAAGIVLHAPIAGLAEAIEAPGTVAADPALSASVSAGAAGRIVSLRANFGQLVKQGDVLAVIDSPDAAELKAGLEAAQRQHDLALLTLQREDRLFKEKVSAEQDLLAARAAEQESQIRMTLAQQKLAAVGGGSDVSSHLSIRAPMAGYVIDRDAQLGAMTKPDQQLFQIAKLSTLSVTIALSPDDAARVRPGVQVSVSAGERAAVGQMTFVSQVIDAHTRQVQAIASLANAQQQWRVGDTVTVSIVTKHDPASMLLSIPKAAIQYMEGRPSVFVRTKDGFTVKHPVLGQGSGGYVPVRSGLAATDTVAVANSYVLKAEMGKNQGGDHDD